MPDSTAAEESGTQIISETPRVLGRDGSELYSGINIDSKQNMVIIIIRKIENARMIRAPLFQGRTPTPSCQRKMAKPSDAFGKTSPPTIRTWCKL
jgi:hypothetical protein